MSSPGHSYQPRDPLEIVSSLRAAVRLDEPQAQQAVVSRLEAIEAAVARVVAERSGMADELLRVYEQLGIIFELTRRLPEVRSEGEVLRLFVRSLQATYPQALVEAIRVNEAGELVARCKVGALPGWVGDALAACRDQRRVVVVDKPGAVAVDNPEVAIVDQPGVVVRDNPQVAVVGKLECRTAEGFPRTAGPSPAEHRDRALVRVMCGPVYAGEALACAMLLGQKAFSDNNTRLRPFDTSDMLLLESLNTFCGDMIRNFRLLAELRQLSVDMVRALISAIEQKDEYTSGHSTRVGRYAVLLAEELGLEAAELQMLEWSALLHDVGKIGIRDTVLKKPGKLTAEEFEHIKEHPRRSFDVVRQVPQLAAALAGVLHHHEHWDGSGYPDGLAGEEIPLMARIIQVADVFDALTSTRSYRRPFAWPNALDILQTEAGSTVDPKLAARFGELIRRLAREEPAHLRDIMTELRRDNEAQSTDAASQPRAYSTTGVGPAGQPVGDGPGSASHYPGTPSNDHAQEGRCPT